MTDILDRLSHEQTRSGMWADTCILLEEAAQEIRKLTIERNEWREACLIADADVMNQLCEHIEAAIRARSISAP